MIAMELFASAYPVQKPHKYDVLVTPDIARTWLLCYRYARQRAIRDYRIGELEEMMRYGSFREYSILTFARCDDIKRLLNGYHRLEAICRFGKAIWFTVEERDVESEEAMDKLYDTYDREMMRSYMDLLRASDFASVHHVTPTLMKVLHSAMPLIISGFTDGGNIRGSATAKILRDTQHIQAFMIDWLDEAEQYLAALSGTDQVSQRMFYRAGVMSVALVTLRYLPTIASDFWHKACHKVGFEEGDVEMALANWLERNSPSPNKKLEYTRYIASAWNGYVDGNGHLKETERARLNRGRFRSFSLHGTPFKGQEDLWFIGDNGEPLRDPVARRRQGYVRDLLELISPVTAQ